MSNINYLNSIIDDDYIELGKSGKVFNKNVVIQELSKLKNDRNIKIYNYTCLELSNNIWMVHYITLSDEKKIYRTSIWKNDNELKIVFHQASEYKEQIRLKEY